MAISNIGENNRARQRLIEQLRTGRLIGCTGAGVSSWAGYHCWRDVITRLADEVERRRPGEVNTQTILQHYAADLLLCAQRLGSDLGEAAFTEFVRTEFGPVGVAPHEVLLRIAALPLRHVLTLNFDTSYEAVHPLIRETCQTVSSSEKKALACFLRDMDDPRCVRQVVHLHGKYDDPIRQIALTEDGYTTLYRRDGFFKNFVWTMASKRLLFVGFGFTDTDFSNILRDCARDIRDNGLNHFGLVGLEPHEDDGERRVYLNGRFLVDPIFYNVVTNDDGQQNHEEFAELINGISGALGMPDQGIPSGPLGVAPGPPEPLDPDDERRAEELNRRLLDRIQVGEDDA